MILENSKHLIWIFILGVFACKNSNDKKLSNIFHYNQPNSITSLDPAFAKSQNNIWVVDHIYNQLLDLDEDLNIVPELAHSWEISEDGLKYIFHLRSDVFYHKDPCFGMDSLRTLKAKDVKFSLLRLTDPKLSAPGSWIFNDKLNQDNPIEVINDSTLIFNLSRAFSPFLSLLTMQYCSILPEEAELYYGSEIRIHPVGTGPFMMHKWLDRQGVFLKKNPNYFKSGLPLLNGVRISFIEDRNTAFLVFVKKGIDFFSGLQSSFAAQLLDEDGLLKENMNDQITMLKSDYLNTEYIGINLAALPSKHILRSKEFRRALNFGFDRAEMIRIFRNGLATPALAGFIPLVLKDTIFQKSYFSYQPDLVKEIIKKLDYIHLPLEEKEIIIHTNKDYVDLISFIARQWQELGIIVKIELVETATLREQMRNGTIGMFRASWIADYPDEESFTTVFYSQNPAPPNYTRFKNVEFDRLYQLAIQEKNLDLREEYYHQMDQILCEESPVIFLFYDQIALFMQNNIEGLKANPINLLKLENVRDSD